MIKKVHRALTIPCQLRCFSSGAVKDFPYKFLNNDDLLGKKSFPEFKKKNLQQYNDFMIQRETPLNVGREMKAAYLSLLQSIRDRDDEMIS